MSLFAKALEIIKNFNPVRRPVNTDVSQTKKKNGLLKKAVEISEFEPKEEVVNIYEDTELIDLDAIAEEREFLESKKKDPSETTFRMDAVDDFTGDSSTISITEKGIGTGADVQDTIPPATEFEINDESAAELAEWEKEITGQIDPIEEIHQFEEKKEYKPDFNVPDSAEERKVETYHVLVEITKELLKSVSPDEFFDNLLYHVVSQLGPETLVLFSSRNSDFQEFEVVAYDGLDVEPSISFSKDSSLVSLLDKMKEPFYAKKYLSEVEERDKVFLLHPNSEIIAPIVYEDQITGFLVAGKSVSASEYASDDFEFLRMIGEIAGSLTVKMFQMLKNTREIDRLSETLNLKQSLTQFAESLYHCKNYNELCRALGNELEKDFDISEFTLMILNPESRRYEVHFSSFFSEETSESFFLNPDSKTIALVSKVAGVYRIENPDSYPELKEALADGTELDIFPLIQIDRLFGLLLIHGHSDKSWTSELKQSLISVSNFISPVLASLILQREQSFILEFPFNRIEELLDKEMQISEKEGSSFTLMILKVRNVARILNQLGQEFLTEYSNFITSILQSGIGQEDHLSRLGQGKYAVILRNKKGESENADFFNWIRRELGKFPYPKREFKMSIQLYSLNYPEQSSDKRKFIEIIEDT
ncbi:MAG TPA: hypothetical protein PL048_12690 [Leptospiraceae bacterium]|nr:hypothetical protein [Leptospiraceae bacterium]HNF17106.1 hypothetical protein [Leptospiraceae bacterium]HNM01333.1 hypothetical protein [Leptospiraceae bacterium]